MSLPLSSDDKNKKCADESPYYSTLAPIQTGPFCKLWRTLNTALDKRTNPVVCIVGQRGYGKRHVLDGCLQSVEESSSEKNVPFRVIRIHGLLLKGDDGAAARQMVRQLSNHAQQNRKRPLLSASSVRSSFHTNMALVDEALKRARVDGIPIWIVIHDVDAFAANKTSTVQISKTYSTSGINATKMQNNKQVLLYHLLDRAASENTYMGIIWTTTRLDMINLLEKRIRSRAVGTQVVLQLTKPSIRNVDFQSWAPCFHAMMVGKHDMLKGEQEKCADYVALKTILSDPKDPLTLLFQRAMCLGKSLRWFQRVMFLSKCRMNGSNERSEKETTNLLECLKMHLLEAFNLMGCDTTQVGHALAESQTEGTSNVSEFQIVVSKLPKFNHNLRLQSLYDLCTSKLLLVFAARRIMVRDAIAAQDTNEETLLKKATGNRRGTTLASIGAQFHTIDMHRPLTFDRLYDEYYTTFAKVGGGTQVMVSMLTFPRAKMLQQFVQLLECDIFRPALDHVGSTNLSYQYKLGVTIPSELDLTTMPLHFMVHLDEELYPLVQNGDLPQLTSVVKEWGMKRFS